MTPRRQATLESQLQIGDVEPTPATRPWFSRQMLSYSRLADTHASYQGLESTDAAIRKASKIHEPDDTFLNTYAHVSQGFKNSLDRIFGTDVLPFDTGVSPFYKGLDFPSGAGHLAAQLENLHRAVTENTDPLLTFLFTTENNNVKASAMWGVLKPLPSQIKHRNGVPRTACIYLLSQVMKLRIDHAIISEIARGEGIGTDTLPSLELPSMTSQRSKFPEDDENSRVWNLRWHSENPKFQSDIDTYIWQPYRKPPPFNFVKIYILKSSTLDHICAVFLFGSIDSLQGFRHTCKSEASTFRETDNVKFRLARYLHAVHRLVINKMLEFLRKTLETLSAITFQGRVYPSKEKVLHILYMNDCRESAIQDLKHNRLLAEEHANFIKALLNPFQDLAITQFEAAMEAIMVDYDFLMRELDSVGPRLRQIQIELESQNNLQSRNTTLITILAAIYVPLAFVTSFLGMNVTDAPVNHWLKANVSSNSTGKDNTTDPSGATSSPSQRLWDMRWFGLLSAPLLFATILLPLLAGPIVRFVSHASLKVGVFWRLIFAILGASYITIFYILTRDTTSYKHNATVFSIYFATCDGPLIFYVGYLCYRVYQTRTWRAIWTCTWIGTIAFICSILDLVYNILHGTLNYSNLSYYYADLSGKSITTILYGVFAWLLIFIVRFISYSRASRRQVKPKVIKKDGNGESPEHLVYA